MATDSTLPNLAPVAAPVLATDIIYIVRGTSSNRTNVGDLPVAIAQVSGTVPYAQLPIGTSANTVAAGDDARFTNSRTPSGNAGGVLAGTYPNPGFAVDMATQAELDAVQLALVASIATKTNVAVVPDAAPNAGQLLIGNAGNTAYAKVAVSGDGTLTSAGALTVTKTNGTNFAASATTDATNAANISSGTLPDARVSGNIARKAMSFTVQTANYTLALTDQANAVTMNAANAVTITVPNAATVAWANGVPILLDTVGAGQITVANGVGVTIQARGGANKSAGQYASMLLYPRGADVWCLTGDCST